MISFALAVATVWALSLLGWFLFSRYLRRKNASQIQGRLTGVEPKKKRITGSPQLLEREDLSTGKIVRGVMEHYRLIERLERLLEQAGLKWNVARFVHGCLSLFLGGFIVGWQFIPGNLLSVNCAIGAIFGVIPLLHVLRLRSKRLYKFEEQFPESLEFVSRSMRAGHAFSGSLEMIHQEFQEPLAGEFKRVFEEHNLGLPLDIALQKLSHRIPSLDVQFFISAVLLQKRTGGNLAEILDKLAYIIRERFKLRGKIRAISAHGRMTGTALSLIPVAVALMMFWVNRSYMEFFFEDEVGHYMIGAAVGLQLIGYGIIKKIVTIEA